MFDFLTSIFRHSFWLIIIVILCILGALSQCSDEAEYKYERYKIESAIRHGNTEKVYERLHDYFVDDCHANPHAIGDRAGVLAAEAIECCIEKGDAIHARKIYREYKFSLPEYAKKEYEGLE